MNQLLRKSIFIAIVFIGSIFLVGCDTKIDTSTWGLSNNSVWIIIGENQQIDVNSGTLSMDEFSYTIEDDAIISVSTTGLIQALEVGTTTIDISYKKDSSLFTVTLTVNVYRPDPTSVVITGDSTVLLGSTLNLSASVLPVTAPQTITWSSSNDQVATVSEAGVVTPLQSGTVMIYAQSSIPSVTGSKEITITRPDATDVIIVGGNTVTLGSTLTLSANLTPEYANQSITWTSSNEEIATVSETGVVTPLQTGSVVIKATTHISTIFDEITITITIPLPTSVVVSGPTSVVVGQNITLSASVLSSYADQSITWSSNNTDLVTITQDGVITGVASGSTSIRATASNGVYQDYAITVHLPAATSVSITGPVSVASNQTGAYSANVLPALANQTVTWSSSNETVATIDQDGVLTPVSMGTTVIKAITTNGVFQEMTITIGNPAPTSIVISGPNAVVLGETITLTKQVLPAEAAQSVTWTSTNTQLALVNASGMIIPLSDGVVVIRATSTVNNQIIGEYSVTITRPAATSVTISGTRHVFEGIPQKFTASVSPEQASQNVIWSSSNETIATVDALGNITGLQLGDVTIRATASDTVFAEMVVTVVEASNDYYVNPDFAGLNGTVVTEGYPSPVYIGLNGFSNIQQAVLALNPAMGYTMIEVAAGTYSQNVVINASNVVITGPNSGIDPVDGTRVPEAIITGRITLGNGSKDLSDISINGFKFTGAAQITQGSNTAITQFDFMFNLIEDITYTTSTNLGFIQFVATSAAKGVANSYISMNKFDNIYSSVTTNVLVRPIWMEYASDVYIIDNTIINFERDIYLKDISKDVYIIDNYMGNTKYRFVHINGFFGGIIQVMGNTMVTSLDAAIAIYGRLEYEPGMTILVEHNHISQVSRGVYVDPEYLVGTTWVVEKPILTSVNYNVILVNHASNYYAQGSNVYPVDFTKNYWGTSTPAANRFVDIPEVYWADYYLTEAEVPAKYTIDYQYPYEISITNSISSIYIDQDYQLEVDFVPVDTNVTNVLWSSSDPTIVRVTAEGKLEALKEGSVTITAFTWYDRRIFDSFEVTSSYNPGIAFEFNHMDSLFLVGDTFNMTAKPYPTTSSQEAVTWSSSNELVATVSEAGVVNMVGVGDVTITARFTSNASISQSMSFHVTGGSDLNNLMEKIAAVQYANIENYNFTVWGSTTYPHSTMKSVSLYYFGGNYVNESIINISPYTRTGRLMSALPEGITQYNAQNIHWIVIHDTGNSNTGSGALSHSNYLTNLTNNPNNTTYVSWHYTVDDAAIYQHIPNNERAFHAGDGSTLVGQHLTYLGGGNTNGIGIEMAIGRGYDIYQVWQKTAKLAAGLAVEYNLPLANIKYHNDFSGKDCPQTLRKSGLISQFEIMKTIEYEVAKNHPEAVITMTSHSPKYLDNSGRILQLPVLGTTISYTITISENGNTVSRTFNTFVKGSMF